MEWIGITPQIALFFLPSSSVRMFAELCMSIWYKIGIKFTKNDHIVIGVVILTTIIVLGIVLISVAMSGTYLLWQWLRIVYDVIAIISAIVSFSAASTTIYSVIRNHTVFMTTIHALFIDPFFLIPSAYLGVYVIYLLYTAIWRQLKQ